MVELRKSGGDTLEFHKVWNQLYSRCSHFGTIASAFSCVCVCVQNFFVSKLVSLLYYNLILFCVLRT